MVVLGKVVGNGIKSIELHQTVGLVDTYRITFDDDTYFDFDITNGKTNLDIQVLTELPSTGEVGVLYFIPNSASSATNIYDEYVWMGTRFEFLGNPRLDLSNYYTKTETDDVIDNKIDDQDVEVFQVEDVDGNTGTWTVKSTLVWD